MKKLTACMVAFILICVVFRVSAQAHTFTDVPDDAWFAENVRYVFDNGLMNGTSDNTFSPDMKMDRAMLVTVLYRLDGSASVSGSVPFTDVSPGAFYYNALVWAYENGIINGISETQFGPGVSINREMMATIFYRYAQSKGSQVNILSSLYGYSDTNKISAYANHAVRWAAAAGIITGDSATTLSPAAASNRAQCAAVLQRLCRWMENGVDSGLPDGENPSYTDGPVAYVNAVRIEDTLRYDGIEYVCARDFCLAMKGAVNSDGSSSLTVGSKTLTFKAGCKYMIYTDKYISLRNCVVTNDEKAYVALKEMCDMLELSVYWDSYYDGVYCTASAWERDIPANYNVPVLMYHAVSNDLWGIKSLFVKPELMEQQLQYLTHNGYDPIFFEDLYHIRDYDKPVILTFDDGYADNYTQLFPLLKKYNVKATVFVLTGSINTNHYLTDKQIKEMSDSGLVSIQSHTVTHPMLGDLSAEAQRSEMAQSKLTLTRITKREPYVLAYPTGDYNSTTVRIIGEYYDFGILMNGNLYNTRDNPYKIKRYFISRDTSTSTYRAILQSAF